MSEKAETIDIDYVARLARIELTDEERKTFTVQLAEVLEHFQKLRVVNVDGVEPTAHAFPVVNVMRDDEPGEVFAPEAAMRNAPKQRDNQLSVPRVVGES